jgi:hypothetical protein
MRFLTRATLSKAFGIVADSEGITLDHALERAYRRALFTLGDSSIAERHAIEVTSALARKWQKDNGQPSADEKPKGYLFQPNRAFQIELMSFIELNKAKEKWLSDYRSGQRPIDRETLAVWFVDHIINYGLRRHSMYAAVGILKVLFNYDYNDIVDVLQYTDSQRWGGFKDKRDRLRRWKKKTFQSLIDWFGDGFLKIEEYEESDDLFIEHRFVKQTVTNETLAKAFTILRFFTPLKPECALAQNRNINLRELEAQLRAHAISSSEHAIERERVHIMDHPDDLFYIVKRATDLDVKTSAQYLELPDFGLGPDGGGPPPIDRQNLPALEPQQRKNIEQEVLRRKKRISKLALESVIIAVDDKERLELPLQGPRAVQLRLNEGDTFVELRSRDQEGSLPLDSFFVPWNPHLIDCEPFRYQAILRSKHQIDFLINYEQDSYGDFSGAVLDIQYRPLVQEEITRSLREQIAAAAFALKTLGNWAIPVLVFMALGGLAYIYFTPRGPSQNPDLATRSGDNSHETAKLPSPSPTVDSRAIPSPTQTASPALAHRQPPRRQKSDVQKHELLARANLIPLDEYRKSSEPDQYQRGEEASKPRPGAYFKIYASRTDLTSVRIKLPEAAPESPDVISLDDGFLHPVVPGKIESVNSGIVTVTLDLRAVPYKRYYLRVARGDKVPKHYLVKLVDARVVTPKK